MKKTIRTFIILILSAFCIVSYAQEKTETKKHSTFKGVELSTWHEAEAGWCFSLLPGTNRRKTMDEITNPDTRIVGIKNLKNSLSSLHAGENVFWVNYAKEPIPSALIDKLQEYAKQIPIKLHYLNGLSKADGKMKALATDIGDYLIKTTIDGTIEKNSTSSYIELGSGLKNKLRSMRGAFNASCHTEVIYGDAPNVGDGKASSHIFLICNKKRKIGIRLGYDKEKKRLRILGYWTSTL